MNLDRLKQNCKALLEIVQNYKNLLYKITSIDNEISLIGDKGKLKEKEKELDSLKTELNNIRVYALKLCNDNASVIKQEKINLVKNAAS